MCSQPFRKGKDNTIEQSIAHHWKACSVTCFKSVMFVTDSKAGDLITLSELCSQTLTQAHLQLLLSSFLQISLFAT